MRAGDCVGDGPGGRYQESDVRMPRLFPQDRAGVDTPPAENADSRPSSGDTDPNLCHSRDTVVVTWPEAAL